MTVETILALLPEIILIAAATTIYLGGAFFDAQRAWSWIAGGALAAAAATLWSLHPATVSGSALNFDGLTFYARSLAVVFGALFVGMNARSRISGNASEYLGSLLVSLVGLMLVAGAANLVLLFVALELISIPTYVLLYLGHRDASSQESAAKYFFLSVLASAVVLYGFSFLYGIAGTTDLSALQASLQDALQRPAGFLAFAKLAMVLVFAGLSFRIAAVPFHFYAPDVYQGTTHPNAAFLSVVPKIAGFLAMVRLLPMTALGFEPYAWRMILVIAAITMTFGNVLALWQENLRRLLSYSSIANAGYMLIALAVVVATGGRISAWDGLGALWFYLTTYAAATIGAFAALEHLGRRHHSLNALDELAGLGRTRPAVAAVLAICMFSLAGIPVLAGFWGKFLVFGSALFVETAEPSHHLRWWFTGIAILGALNAAVGAVYYLRIVASMYFRTPLATPSAEGGRTAWYGALACSFFLVAAGVYPSPLMQAADKARPDAGARHGQKNAATPACPSIRSDGGNEQQRGRTLTERFSFTKTIQAPHQGAGFRQRPLPIGTPSKNEALTDIDPAKKPFRTARGTPANSAKTTPLRANKEHRPHRCS